MADASSSSSPAPAATPGKQSPLEGHVLAEWCRFTTIKESDELR